MGLFPELSGNTCRRSPGLARARATRAAPAGQTIGLLSLDSRRWAYLTSLTKPRFYEYSSLFLISFYLPGCFLKVTK